MLQLFNLKPISKFTRTKIRRRRKFGFHRKGKLGIRNKFGLPRVHHACSRQPKSSTWSGGGGSGELGLLHVPFGSSDLELIKVIKRRKLKKLFLHKSHTTHKHGSFIFLFFFSLFSVGHFKKLFFLFLNKQTTKVARTTLIMR